MQFTLGPPAAPGYAPQPSNTDFEAVGRTATEDRDPDEPLPGRRTSTYQVAILTGIAAVLMAGTALAIVAKLVLKTRGGGRSGESVLRDKDRNINIDALPVGWTQDETTRQKIGTPYAYGFRRENPEAYLLFGAIEYGKGRSPRASEMRRDLELPMRKLFTKYEEELPPESSWLGQPIRERQGFRFRAPSADGLIWQGEAYTVQTRGMAYFWLNWCSEGDFDAMKDEFTKCRSRFQLLDDRKDWRESVPKEIDYKGATVPYTFGDAEDIWVEQKDTDVEPYKKLNPDLDRWLRINHTPRTDRRALSDDADLRVYLLDGTNDPLGRAREYVEGLWTDHIKNSGGTLPAPTFAELTDEVQGDSLPKGATPVVRLASRVVDPANPKKVLASSESRLIVVSGARIGDRTVVLHCWCELAKREVFEARFVQIASSLR
ncbi:MAG: hypothetical protein ACKODX_05250 [Gemmata sp.]